ncbi:MAG TPA: FtsX-like permease family protein [Pyrinomonadaceae bacterium]|nr:FtsX-like permease family protein [Pyrinomonadaceae bacterium]
MKFIFNMARRELLSSWRRLLFFFLCIGVGVGSVVALRSLIRNLNAAVAGEARQLLTADVQVDSTRAWTPKALEAVGRVSSSPRVEARTETVEATTMLRPADESREGALLVELKGVEPAFPLVGEFKLAGGERFNHELLANNGAVVAPLVLERLRLSVGDEVNVNEATFTIRGVIGQEPGASSGFRVGPRVFVAREAFESAGLTGFGSRARRRILLRTREGEADEVVRGLREELRSELVGVRSYRDSQESLGESFARAENYLSLAGLVILVLGGIGVSSVTRVFVEQKRKTIAVLKCVGGTGRQVTAAYLAQTLALGAAGSLLGVALAKAGLAFAAGRFAESLPPNMSYGLATGAVAQGVGLGLLISALFSALPLLRIRHVKPSMLLRDEDRAATGRARRFDWTRWLTALFVGLGLAALATWQAGSLLVGAYFLAGLAATAALLYIAALLLVFLLRRTRRAGSFALRQAINSLHRPGNQTRVIVMAVGLGAFLVMTVQSVQSNLLDELDLTRRGSLPNMFLLDVQEDQKGGVAELVERATGTRAELIPTMRARIYAVNGRRVDLENKEQRRDRGMLGREYVVTYRPNLEANETIVAGKFWDASGSAEPEVSIEEDMRGLAGMDVGSTVTFDIMGRKVDARVTSLRRVDWRNSRTGFLVLFRPGSLEGAPATYIGAINGPEREPERSRFQRELVDRYPNVSVIDVADIVRNVGRILSNITLAVSFVGGFVLLCGVLILVGSIAMTKFQRVYEAAVLKALGAPRKTLLAIMLAEYGLLGLVSGIIGALAAVALSYAVARYVFEIPWTFAPALSLLGIITTAALVVAVGALSSFDVLTRKPLGILRAQ